MSTAIESGPLLSLNQIAATLPGSRGAANVNPATLTRWIIRGMLGSNGQRVRLAATRLGCRWMTTAVSVAEFQHALTVASIPTGGSGASRSPNARQKASEAAARELESVGA